MMAERNIDANRNTFNEGLIDPRLLELDAASRTPGSDTQGPASGLSLNPPLSTASARYQAPAQNPGQVRGPVPVLPQSHHEHTDGNHMQDQNEALPSTVYTSLNHLLTTHNVTPNEWLWFMGVQSGIGLGIMNTREAILNEMQHYRTVFNRPIQLDAQDIDHFNMRMKIGQACTVGFDLRVAQRAATAIINQQRFIAQIIVKEGLTWALPGMGDPMIGTSTFFSDEDIARCFENSQQQNKTFPSRDAQEQPGPEMDGGHGAGARQQLTASFPVGGPNIGGIDMTKLDGTAGLIANAITLSSNSCAAATPRPLNESPESPVKYDLTRGFPPIATDMRQPSPFGGGVAPTMPHLNKGPLPPVGTFMPHRSEIRQSSGRSRNDDRGGDETEEEKLEDFEYLFKDKPESKLTPKQARATRGGRGVTKRPTKGGRGPAAPRNNNKTRGVEATSTTGTVREPSPLMDIVARGGMGTSASCNIPLPTSSADTTSSGEDSFSSDNEQVELHTSLTETESGLAVIRTVRRPRRSRETG